MTPRTAVCIAIFLLGCACQATERTYAIKGIVVARTVANLSAYWEVEALVSRTGATTTLVNSTVTKIHDATAGLTLAAAVDDTTDVFQLDATGIAATVIRWSASLQITEIRH